MSTNRLRPHSGKESDQSKFELDRHPQLMMPLWQPDGPILRFFELLKVTRVSRTKAYELMKSDPDFPKGIPLYDQGSTKFYWTHEAIAWIESRAAKFHTNEGA